MASSELIPFGANSDLRWNCPAGTSELTPFDISSDLLWDLRFPEIPSRGFLLVSTCWGILCLLVRGELQFPQLGLTIIILSLGTTAILETNM